MLKNFIKNILIKISRIIYYITPKELYLKSDLQLKINENLVDETFNHFKEHLKQSVFFYNHFKIRNYAIKNSLLNDKNKEYYYLEFGVLKGVSANFFSKFVDKLYCFDSFEGMKEDWAGSGTQKGDGHQKNKLPKFNSNVEPIVGWVEDTLDDFLKKHKPKINFVHLDMDTYSPTKFTLEKIKPYLVKDAIILFDELYNYPGWEYGEYKALKEVFKEDEFKYKAFQINGGVSVISIK